MRKKFSCLLIAAFFMITFLFSGCSANSSKTQATKSDKITIKDMAGRTVTLNKKANKAVAIGPGSLRLYCYVNGSTNIVGVEQFEKGNTLGKPYMMANPDLTKLPVIGLGGPRNAPDPEKILAVKPDVIFYTYSGDTSQADDLQAKTKIPVIILSYGKVSTFDPAIYSSLEIIGKVTGNEKGANEAVNYMEKCKNDLDNRTKDIPDSEKPNTYVGALGKGGAHGIESTQGNYSLFNAVHAKNVVDETGKTGSMMIDKEKLIKWNPDKLFIDEGGLKMVMDDYKKNPKFYENLSAFKNGEVYLQMPYNFYSTNIDTAIADAYYIGKVLYPQKFNDIDPEKKADEVYKTLLGKELYDSMEKGFGGFKKLTLN